MIKFCTNSNKLTLGTIWQAKAIIGLAKQILSQGNSPQARIALANGIKECALAIEAHETPSPYPPLAPINESAQLAD